MRPAVALLVLLTLAASAPGAAAQDDPLTAEERAWLEGHGPLRIIFTPTGPPFELESHGQLQGINSDVLSLISVKTGISFEVRRAATFDEAYAAMEDGTADLMGLSVRTEDREAAYEWTRPYAWARTGFWVSERHPDVTTPEQIMGRIGVANAVHAKLVNQTHPHLEQVRVANAREAVEALAEGEVDALYTGYANAAYYARSAGYTELRTVGEPQINEVRWAAREGDAMALSIMDKGLAQLEPRELLAIYVKWTGQDLGPPAVAAQEVAFALSPLHRGLLAGAAGLVVVLAAGTVFLRRQVAARTRELAALNRDLERAVAARTSELQDSNQELQVFTSTVAHDLRTRLTAAIAFTQLIRMKQADALDERGRHHLERLESTHRRMGQLMEDVLCLSRAGRASLERAPVDLSALAREVARMLEEESPGRRVDVRVEDGLVARADAALMRLVMENLLGNAWKYSARREDARVEVGLAKTERGAAFFVRDNGAGFDSSQAHRLFRPFERLHDATDFEGIGIGLATVARVVERHGGAVWAEGGPGEGATFYFTLGERG